MDAAQRNNDFAGEKVLVLAADPNTHAGRAPALEQKPGYQGIAGDAEIATATDVGGEIANRGRGTLWRPVAHRHGTVAVPKIGVHVRDEGNLPFLRESMHRFRQRRPVCRRRAPDRHRSILAMQRTVEIPIVFQLAVIGKHAFPAPRIGAEHFPLSVIVRRAAVGHHADHRRANGRTAGLPARSPPRRRRR
jgi:hypothetical protein